MNQTILFIKKADKGNLPTDDVIDIFKESNNLEEIKSAVERAEDRVYVSWATVDVVDRDQEKVPIKDLINDQDTLLKRNGPISDMHTNNIVGQTMAYKVMEHPKEKKIGILHLNKIFSDNEIDDKVWKETQSGERQGSSVGGFSKEDTFEKDEDTGQMIRVKDKFRQYETANVFKPSNPLALNEATSLVAKSYKDVPGTILFKSKVEKQADYGSHLHDGENPEGLHSHPEIDKKGDSVINKDSSKDNYELFKSKEDDLTMDKIFNKNKEMKGGPGSGRKPEGGTSTADQLSAELRQRRAFAEALKETPAKLKSREKFRKLPAKEQMRIMNELSDALDDKLNQKKEMNKKSENNDSVINKSISKDIKLIKSKKGDLQMDKEVKKEFSDINAKIDGVVKSVASLAKQEDEEDTTPTAADEEEKTKKQETEEEENKETKEAEDDKEEVAEKKTKKAEDEDDTEEETVAEKKVKKEEAASDIDGEKETGKPDSPEPEDNNEEQTFKNSPILKTLQKQMADVQKAVKSLRPSGDANGPLEHVAKLEKEKAQTALDIATGKKKMSWSEVNKMQRDVDQAKVEAFNHKRL